MIAGLFSKKKKDKANPEKGLETIKNLNLQIDTLEKKLDFYEKQMNTLTAEAKAKLKAKDKNGAKKLLAKKTRINSQIKQLGGAQNMLEEQKGMLENSQMMKDVIGTLKQTGEYLKVTSAAIKAEDIDQIKEDMEEMKASQDEIGEMFGEYNNENNEEIDEELGDLEKEIADEEVNLPSANKEDVPVERVEIKQNVDEKAFENFLD